MANLKKDIIAILEHIYHMQQKGHGDPVDQLELGKLFEKFRKDSENTLIETKESAIRQGFSAFCNQTGLEKEYMASILKRLDKSLIPLLAGYDDAHEEAAQNILLNIKEKPLFLPVLVDDIFDNCNEYKKTLGREISEGHHVNTNKDKIAVIERLEQAARGIVENTDTADLKDIDKEVKRILNENREVLFKVPDNALTKFLKRFGTIGDAIINSRFFQRFFSPQAAQIEDKLTTRLETQEPPQKTHANKRKRPTSES